jgi:hypothetical protein
MSPMDTMLATLVRTGPADDGWQPLPGRHPSPTQRDAETDADLPVALGRSARRTGRRSPWSHRAGTVARPPYDRAVAYDEALAERIRELLVDESDITEKKMFGGLAFLIRGNMAVAASGQGGVLVRVDPAKSDRLIAATDARNMEMRGRAMQGWLRVDADVVRTKRQLAEWVGIGTAYAGSLPPKAV